uniref:Uncharacterized protein n=1 Tax=Tetranychus urticae TaxID=32264 RepID=T1K2X5_TETUR
MVALVLAGGDKGGDNIILSGGEGKGHGGCSCEKKKEEIKFVPVHIPVHHKIHHWGWNQDNWGWGGHQDNWGWN